MPRVKLVYDFTNYVSLGGENYEYVVELTPREVADDLIETFIPNGQKGFIDFTREKQNGFFLAIDILCQNDLISENDNGYYEVGEKIYNELLSQYFEEALEECLKEYKEYRYEEVY